MKKEIKFRKKIWCIFCFLYIISFLRNWNLALVRYLALIIIQIFSIYDIVKTKHIIINKRMMILISIISISMLISNFASENLSSALLKTLSILDLLILSVILLPTYLRNIKFEEILLCTAKTIFIILFLTTLIFRNDYVYLYSTGRMGSETRLYAGFNHPNVLGDFAYILILNCLILLFYYSKKLNRLDNIFLLFASCLSIYLILESDCRTAIIVTILLICLIIYDKLFKKYKKFKALLVLMIISCIIIFGINYIDRLDFNNLDRLLSYRLSYVLTAIENLNENGTFLFGNGAYRNSEFYLSDGVLLDNGYINFMYQYGFITLMLILIFIIYVMLKIKTINNRDIRNILFMIFTIFLVYNIAVNALMNISSLLNIYVYILIFKEFVRKMEIEE